jgi:hypothetical protein
MKISRTEFMESRVSEWEIIAALAGDDQGFTNGSGARGSRIYNERGVERSHP